MSEVKKGKRSKDEHKKKLSENHANVSGKNNSMSKSVICLTTKRIVYSASEGSEYYNCNANNIRLCCKGKRKSSGKLNGEKLVWRYLIWNHNKKYRIKDRVSIDATEY